MGEIRLSVGQVNILNYMRIDVREVASPNIVVVSQVVPPPVPASQNIIFTGLNPVVHYVDFRSSNDAISPGLLLATFVYDVKNQTLISERRFYTGAGPGQFDPPNQATSITDPYLNGKTVSGIFKEGFRFLIPSVEWSQTDATINFLQPNLLISEEEVVAVEISYLINVVGGNTTSFFPANIIEVTGNIMLDETHRNNLIECNGSSLIQTLTLPPFSLIPDNTKYAFNTDKGSQRYTTIVIDAGGINYALLAGRQRTKLYVGKSEYLVLQKKGDYVRILDWRGDYKRVGEVVTADIPPINSIPEIGGWLDIDDYVRIFEWYILELDPGLLGVATYPNIPAGDNIRKWCIDLANGKFWVPDTGGMFPRYTDPDGNIDTDRPAGDRKAGTTQGHQVGEFTWPVPKGNSYTGNPNNDIFGNGAAFFQFRNLTVFSGRETRPRNINRNQYRLI